MALEIKVGPPQIAIHNGHAVLVTEPDGSVAWPTDKGLYFFDTRLVSAWASYANGAAWELLSTARRGDGTGRSRRADRNRRG